jgi:hypothetical protein
MDVWQLIEDAPVTLADTCELYSWSTNYDAGSGPFSLFLDLIGYSDEEFGMPIYGPTVRLMGEYQRASSWDENLGYVELEKLGRALREYAIRPHDVREFVDQLMRAESEE